MTTESIPASAPGVITVDLAAIRANWRSLANFVAPAKCGAVVKADAYGLGAARIVPALAGAGCRHFFVATAGEALAARTLLPDGDIFALDGLLPGSGPDLLAARAIPVLASLAEVREWHALATARGERLPAVLQIDTGLNRLGLAPGEVQALAAEPELLGGFDLRIVMSHLASADDPADPKNGAQRQAFDAVRAILPPAPASLAASDGLMLGRDYHYDLVRPGYALYGGQAFRGRATPVAPALKVEARVLLVRDVAPGETVGYSGAWQAKRASRIAIVAAGYDDGIPRSLSTATGATGGTVGFRGAEAPIAGRVSMDLITVDVTDLAAPPKRGDLVDIVGPGRPVEAIANCAGTIGYEILTRLGGRFYRVYRDGDE